MNTISPEELVSINKHFGSGTLIRDLGSIYASYMYYDDIESQIMSVITNFVKGHYFVDGNKRTSVILLHILTICNNIKLNVSNNDLDKYIIKIVEDNLSVSDSVKLIFN